MMLHRVKSLSLGVMVVGTFFGAHLALADAKKSDDVAGGEPVLEIDGKVVREADLPPSVRNGLFDNKQQAFEKNANELKEYAVRLALARAKNPKVDPKKLPALDDLIEVKEPTEAEIKTLFEASTQRLPPNAKLEDFRSNIVQYLKEQSMGEAFGAKVKELEKQGKIKVIARAPVAPVIMFDLSKFPAKGPANAPVVLVEASDYLCPHCQGEQPEVDAVLKEFEGKIRFVQVNFALRPDGLSGELARGAHCARGQSDEAFWKFHAKAFAMKIPQSPTPDRPKVLEVAKGAGIDVGALEKCLATAEPKAAVEQAVAAMSEVGVSGTPAFFLNGRKLHTDHVSLKDAVKAALDGKDRAH